MVAFLYETLHCELGTIGFSMYLGSMIQGRVFEEENTIDVPIKGHF